MRLTLGKPLRLVDAGSPDRASPRLSHEDAMCTNACDCRFVRALLSHAADAGYCPLRRYAPDRKQDMRFVE